MTATAYNCRFLPLFTILLCVSARSAEGDVPAVIVHPNAESLKELTQLVSKALHRDSVTLADDALTSSNLLALDHAPIHDANGRANLKRCISR